MPNSGRPPKHPGEPTAYSYGVAHNNPWSKLKKTKTILNLNGFGSENIF